MDDEDPFEREALEVGLDLESEFFWRWTAVEKGAKVVFLKTRCLFEHRQNHSVSKSLRRDRLIQIGRAHV